MEFATDKEIRWAHDLLLPDKSSFDDEKVAVIKENKSCYVQACPGSGKTTTLLAKLAILANRMPLPMGQGICVLTHTNVAMDEIKSKLGGKADILFKYPNFFGTFQMFVHQFLTEQAMWFYYGRGIEVVDDEVAQRRLWGKYLEKSNRNLRGFIYHKYKKLDILEKEYVYKIGLDYIKQKIIYDKSKEICGFSSESGRCLLALKEELFKEGILSFDDAYQLGFRFLRETGIPIKDISASRFKYLFVDEMQDMNSLQKLLVEVMFSDTQTIVQRFGDHNQAIFENSAAVSTEIIQEGINYINLSLRFGANIANVVRAICPERNDDLQGNKDIYSSIPIMLVFDSPESVLPVFVNLLKNEQIQGTDISIADYAKILQDSDPLKRNRIKAIGWTKCNDGNSQKLAVSSYFPSYLSVGSTAKKDKHFEDFLRAFPGMSPSEQGKEITNGILWILEMQKIKTENDRFYTRTTFEQMLRKNNLWQDYMRNLISWVFKLMQDNSLESFRILRQQIIDFLNEILLCIGKSPISVDNENLLVQSPSEISIVSHDNLFKKDDVSVEVTNVHSVKGETHVATLYLETSYHGKTESIWLKDLFENNRKDISLNSYAMAAAKVAFVGLSRATHFLCFAISRENFSQLNENEIRKSWRIYDVSANEFI